MRARFACAFCMDGNALSAVKLTTNDSFLKWKAVQDFENVSMLNALQLTRKVYVYRSKYDSKAYIHLRRISDR